jgi:2-pyrone-4,6-dicarboxylate lactonase
MSKGKQMASIDAERSCKTPNYHLPANSCDTHCHVFGPGNVYPYSPTRKYTPEDAPKEDLANLHLRLGVERAVIVQASCHGTDNSAMLDAIQWRPDHYRGVAIVDETFTDRDYQRLDDGGVRGVRFNFVKHLGGAPDMRVFRHVLDRVSGLGWHVVLHLDAVDIAPLSEMIQGLTMPFVIDHMGRVDTTLGTDQPAFQTLLSLTRNERCWVKVCGSERISQYPFDAAVPFAAALIEAIPDRVLWGTDFPHPNLKQPVDEADLVDLVQKFTASGLYRRKLLVDNPARLYGFAR